MRFLIVTIALLSLTSCGARVTGEIGKACIAADRSAANSRLCSCVQQAANATLNGSDQIRAATFFANPELAQETRQSGGSAGRFWDRYKRFTETARQSCG